MYIQEVLKMHKPTSEESPNVLHEAEVVGHDHETEDEKNLDQSNDGYEDYHW